MHRVPGCQRAGAGAPLQRGRGKLNGAALEGVRFAQEVLYPFDKSLGHTQGRGQGVEGRNGTTYTGRWQILASMWFKDLCKVNKFSMHGGGGKAASGEGGQAQAAQGHGAKERGI